MKHNWEYKKLGEVCKVSPFSGIPQVVEDKSWLLNLDKIQSNNGQVMEYDYLNPDAIDGSVTKFNEQNVLFSKLRPNLNKVVVPERSGYCTTELVPLFPDDNIDRHFLAYYLRNPHFVALMVDKVGGAKMPRVKMNEFWKALCPVPPKAVQEQIVAELDKLNEMIATRKEQLKELDNLAQSLFYDTFGDPVSNPKNWSQKFFSQCFRLKSGDGLSAKEIKEGPYPVYGGNGIVGHHSFSNLGGLNLIIGRVGALCGNVRLVSGNIFVTDNAFVVYLLHDFNLTFALHLLTILNLRKYAKAVAQPVISNISLQNIPIILPPLDLQQQFATQVEAIERQKELVEASISELQTLLDSRMDYWFN